MAPRCRDQSRTQQQRIATAVHSLSKELGQMASASDESGPLTDLAQQASRRGGEIAHWLEHREPADVLKEVKRFARRRPVLFLGACTLAGILAGRLARGAVAANTSLDSADSGDDARAISASISPSYQSAGSPSGYAVTGAPLRGAAPSPATGNGAASCEGSGPVAYPAADSAYGPAAEPDLTR